MLFVSSTQLYPSWRTPWCCSTRSLCSASSTSSPSRWAGTSPRVCAGFTSTESSRTSLPLKVGTLVGSRPTHILGFPASVSQHLVEWDSASGWLSVNWHAGLLLDSHSTLLIFRLALVLSSEVGEQWRVWTGNGWQMRFSFYRIFFVWFVNIILAGCNIYTHEENSCFVSLSFL